MQQSREDYLNKRREYNVRHRDKINEQARNWYYKHREERIQYQREYNRKRRNEISQRRREYRQLHQQEVREKQKNQRVKHPNAHAAQLQAERHVDLELECEICGSKEYLVRHHPDYTKPLEVMTVCKSCHNILHQST